MYQCGDVIEFPEYGKAKVVAVVSFDKDGRVGTGDSLGYTIEFLEKNELYLPRYNLFAVELERLGARYVPR